MILAQRSAMIGNGLPYDAEVDYVESTGTQYVDTGYIRPAFGLAGLTMDMAFTELPTGSNYMYSGTQGVKPDYNRLTVGIRWNGYYNYQFGSSGVNYVVPYDTLRHVHFIDEMRGMFGCDGVDAGSTSSGATGNQNLMPFLVGAASLKTGEIDGVSAFCKARFYGVRLYSSGVLVRDFRPVRVGTVGFLYDRANPTGGPLGNGLYGNAGTGSFVIGPDVLPSSGGGRKYVTWHSRRLFRHLFEERRAA